MNLEHPNPSPAPLHRFTISKAWLAFIGIFLVGVILLCAIGPIYWLLHAPDWSLEQRLALGVGVSFAGLTSLYLFKLPRYQIQIWSDRIRYQGAWRHTELRFSDIEGFRVLPTQYVSTLIISPTTKSLKKIQLGLVYEPRAELLDWLRTHLVDLDRADEAADLREIAADQNLGSTKEQRFGKLANARKWTRTLTFMAFLAIAWVFFHPDPYAYAVGLSLALPIASLLLLVWSGGVVRFDDTKKGAYPNVAVAFMLPAVAVSLRAILDWNVLQWGGFWTPFAVLGVGMMIALACAAADVRKKTTLLITGAIFCFVYSYGAVLHLNCFYDRSAAQVYRCKLREQHVSRGKTTTYHFTLAPFIDGISERKVDVPAAVYQSYQVGDTVSVEVRAGALGIPWFAVR